MVDLANHQGERWRLAYWLRCLLDLVRRQPAERPCRVVLLYAVGEFTSLAEAVLQIPTLPADVLDALARATHDLTVRVVRTLDTPA